MVAVSVGYEYVRDTRGSGIVLIISVICLVVKPPDTLIILLTLPVGPDTFLIINRLIDAATSFPK